MNFSLLPVLTCGMVLLAGCARAPEPEASPRVPPTDEDHAPPMSPSVDPEAVPLADLGSDLDYRVEARVESEDRGGMEIPILVARVTVTNAASRVVRLEHGGCSLMLEAYRPGAEDRPPVWRQALAGSWPAGAPYACPLPLIVRALRPGESYDGGAGVGRFEARVPVAEIFGDSLPTGRYVLAAVLHVNRDSIRLSAGEVVLPPAPYRLASEYSLDGFHYAARGEPVPDQPQTYEVRVVVSNAGLRPDLTRYVRSDCPIILHAYRSADAQRTAPPAPAWQDPRHCGPAVEPMRLSGEDESVLVRRFTAREVLGDSLPAGAYHFTAIVMLGHGPGAAARTVWLDVGAVSLR